MTLDTTALDDCQDDASRADDETGNYLGDYIYATMPQIKHDRMFWAAVGVIGNMYAVDVLVDTGIVLPDKWHSTHDNIADAKNAAHSLLDAYYEHGWSIWDFVTQDDYLRGKYDYVTENEVINGCTWWAGVDKLTGEDGDLYGVTVYMDNETLYEYEHILLDSLPEAVEFAIEMMHSEQADYHSVAQAAKAAGDAIEEMSEALTDILAQPIDWENVDVSFEDAVARMNDDVEPEVDTAEYMNWLISRTVKNLMQTDDDIREYIMSEFAPYKDLSACREFTNGCTCADSCAFGVNTNASE